MGPAAVGALRKFSLERGDPVGRTSESLVGGAAAYVVAEGRGSEYESDDADPDCC